LARNHVKGLGRILAADRSTGLNLQQVTDKVQVRGRRPS